MLTRLPAVGASPIVPDHADVAETEVWFGPVERPLHGWVCVPSSGRAAGGVVLCPPVGEEGRATHRTFRRLALALAAADLVAVRFDYDGTGDSAGRQDDPDRVAAWLASIATARALLRDVGAPSTAVLGMRLGATLAARAAADAAAAGDPWASLVLWDPCRSGRTFLREGEALHRLGDGASAAQQPGDGLVHTPGFQYDAATAADLGGLDLAALPTDRPLAGRTLLLARPDRRVPRPVSRRLAAEGDRLDEGPAADQHLLLDLPPSDCLVPWRALRAAVTWLAGRAGEVTAALDPSVLRRADDGRPVLLPSDGTGSPTVHERSVRLGPAGLFGLVSEPADDGVTGPRPWAVLVNVAAEHHAGPGRRWVEFARRWAAQGHRVVRLDQSGVGDSPTRPGQLEDAVFAPQWLTDLDDVLAELGGDGSPVVVLGLCSGAYSAFEAALRGRVDAVLAVNPRLTLFPAARGVSAVHTAERRAASVPSAPVARLARHHRLVAGGLWRIWRQAAPRHAPTRVLRDVARRGTVVEVLACPDDARHFTEVVAAWPLLQWLRLTGRVRFERVRDLDHSLLGRRSQELVWERASDLLRRRRAAWLTGAAGRGRR